MRRPKAPPQDQTNAVFIGSTYSNAELEFLLEHLGESPEVAIPEDVDLPVGVNIKAVEPFLDRTFRLSLLEKALREQYADPELVVWCGFDKLREICQATLDWNATVQDLKRRTAGSDGPIRRAAGAPSLHMWDPDTDIPYLGGVGADSDIVRTAIDGNQRIPLYVMLRESGLGAIRELRGVASLLKSKKTKEKEAGAVVMARKTLEASTPSALEYDHGETTSVVRCPICGHTEVFETTKPSTKRQAETRMRRHVTGAKIKKDQHHILAQRIASGKAGTARQPEPEPEEELVPAGD